MTAHRRRRPEGRRAVWFSAAAAVAVIAAAALALSLARQGTTASGPIAPSGFGSPSPIHPASGAQSSHGSGQPSPGGSGTSPGDPGIVFKEHGPAARLIPASGAYLGAYVGPTSYTPDAEIAAVQGFQQSVGSISLVHNYHPWYSPFPNAADRYFVRTGKVLLLTWGGTPDTRRIVAGDYDSLIRERAEAVKRLHRPILLEFRHEMDRPNLQWAIHGPKNFIAAWDHVRTIFAKVGATNVGWVWCPSGWGFRNDRAQPFYPGNGEVDWVCADIYSVSSTQTLQDAASPFLTWARHTHKPVLIGEFAAGGSPAEWPRWLLAAGGLAEYDSQIKGMAYFDANGTDSQGRSFQYWLGSDEPALHAFRQMLSWPTFHPVLPSSQ
ncbi:MAG: hypothetical protein ACTHJW_14420 [Streptosporangiaceae bacterium]